jgi:hypothetical protein
MSTDTVKNASSPSVQTSSEANPAFRPMGIGDP